MLDVEGVETAAGERRQSHLPHQPVHGPGARIMLGRQKGAELLGEVKQDRIVSTIELVNLLELSV